MWLPSDDYGWALDVPTSVKAILDASTADMTGLLNHSFVSPVVSFSRVLFEEARNRQIRFQVDDVHSFYEAAISADKASALKVLEKIGPVINCCFDLDSINAYWERNGKPDWYGGERSERISMMDYACSCGHVQALRYLLDRKGDECDRKWLSTLYMSGLSMGSGVKTMLGQRTKGKVCVCS